MLCQSVGAAVGLSPQKLCVSVCGHLVRSFIGGTDDKDQGVFQGPHPFNLASGGLLIFSEGCFIT